MTISRHAKGPVRRMAQLAPVIVAGTIVTFAGCMDFNRFDQCRRVACTELPGPSPEARARDDTEAGSPGGGEVFVTGQAGVFGLALGLDPSQGPTLYWTTPAPSGSVASCSLAGCTSPKIVSSGGDPRTIAWSGLRPFWHDSTSPSAIWYVDQAGVAVAMLASHMGVFWVMGGDTHNVFIGGERRPMLIEGDFSGTSTLSCDSCMESADRIAARAHGLAWTRRQDGTIHFHRFGDQGSLTKLAAGGAPRGIVMDQATIYWSTDDGRIRATGRPDASSSGTPLDLATDLPEPTWLAVDESSPFLYFSAYGTVEQGYADGKVGKVLKAGGELTILATCAHPEAIVVSATHVYWANSYDGTIRRVPK